MITLFSVPKKFTSKTSIPQTNAILSWKMLGPSVKVVIFSDDPETIGFARKNGISVVRRLKTNINGTPYINSVFERINAKTKDPILAYVNSDILLNSSFLDTVKAIHKNFSEYLLIGRRIDFSEKTIFYPGNSLAVNQYIKIAKNKGRLHPVTGSDYFIFPRNFWKRIPPMLIGRTAVDNWFINQGRIRADNLLIDTTKTLTCIHQDHDYFHVKGGRLGKIYASEVKYNEELTGRLTTTIDVANLATLKVFGKIHVVPRMFVAPPEYLSFFKKNIDHLINVRLKSFRR